MLVRTAQAGSLESSDCLVVVSPAEGFKLDYKGQNSKIFKERTFNIAQETAERYSPRGADVRVQDQGALEVTLRARIETAFERAMEVPR